jgi:hypothetical protein
MSLQPTIFDEFIDLLRPLVPDEPARQTLLRRALGDDAPILDKFDYSGTADVFITRTVQQLVALNDGLVGREPLLALLDAAAQAASISEARIQAIQGILLAPEAKPSDQHVFVSYARKNSVFVQQLVQDLEARNIRIWIDKDGLKAGTRDWEQSLRKAIRASRGALLIASEDSCQSMHVRDELAIADAEGKPIYPIWAMGDVWINCIPLGRGSMQYIDARGAAYDTALTEIIAVLEGRSSLAHLASPPVEDKPYRNPFKGLRPFRAEDREDFFGRDLLINDLLGVLDTLDRQARLMAIVGPSGSGKSSVVMAGLLPALQNGASGDSAFWIYSEPMVPGAHPVENLTAVLAQLLPQRSQVSIREDLDQKSARGLHRLARQIGGSKPVRVVLYIDQFEELFTLTKNEAERQQFIDLVTTAATEPEGHVLVILSLRADFYDRPMQYAALGALISACTQPVLPMSLADLQATVQNPAAKAGLGFEDGLVSELIFDVRDHVSALPLLQFTLDQLYERRDGRRLTLAAYREIGGVQGALARHAQATYDNLPSPEHQRSAQTLFLRLVEPGTVNQEATHRRATLQELNLADVKQTARLREVAGVFIRERLLTTNRVGEVETIEISHEALIREWDLLKSWLREAHNDIRFRRKLSADIAVWQRHEEASELLYRGKLLFEAEAWVDRNSANRDEMRFIETSIEQREIEKQAQIARALREWTAVFQRMLLHLVQRYLGAALGAGIVFGVLGFNSYSIYRIVESDQVFYANRLRNTLALGIQFGILTGVPVLVATELPARFHSVSRFGRIVLGWLGSATLTVLVFVLLYLNKLVNGDMRTGVLVLPPLLFTAGFTLASGLTRRTWLRWLTGMIGVFLAVWPPNPQASYPLFNGFFVNYPGAGYMLRISLFAAFMIGSFTFLPEFIRFLVTRCRKPALNK